jgi:hypothetical protein
MSDRYQELLNCFLTAYDHEEHCSIVDSNTTWEGERWTETLPSGDSMTLGGMTIPLSVQFLVCKNHLPVEAHQHRASCDDARGNNLCGF